MFLGFKIIFVLGDLELGGAERQALIVARHLQNYEGAKVEIWGLGKSGRLSELCKTLDIPCKHLNVTFGSGLIVDFMNVLSIIRHLRSALPDIVLPYTWFPNVLCGLVWRFTGSKTCVWNQRDSGIALDRNRMVHRLAVKLAPFYISNSPHAARFLVDNFGIEPQKLAVVPNGIQLEPPIDDRKTWRSRLGVSSIDFVGCMLANFSKLKDHVTAVKAWRLVVDNLEKRGRHALLVLAGRDDGMAGSVRTLIRELKLENNVCIIESVEDVSGLLLASDIGIHCAEQEGCPNAVLEEMASGLPVVATDNSGVRMVLRDSCDAFIANQQDLATLANLIIPFALDDNYRLRIGKSNMQRVAECFTVEKMCTDTVAVFRSVLEAAK